MHIPIILEFSLSFVIIKLLLLLLLLLLLFQTLKYMKN